MNLELDRSTMQNLFLGDYPPIPECFSHLISQSQSNEVSSSSNHQLPWQQDDHNKADVADSLYNYAHHEDSDSVKKTVSDPELNVICNHEASSNETTLQGTFQKLNSSLGKLQREMKDLRSLDISLFYQLLALNEAIQDFKLNASDRFSESGSEYSLGTASYMGSMTSLNDDSDWGEDGTLLNSPTLEANETLVPESGNSTTQLLMQINDLALKADQDF